MSDTDTPHISTPNQNEEETKRNETTFSELLESTESKDEQNLNKSAPKVDTDSANGDSKKNVTPHISTSNQNEEETKQNETTFSELLESTESTDEHNVSKSAPKTDTEPANGDSEKNQEKCKSLPAEQNDHKTEATTTTCQDLGTSNTNPLEDGGDTTNKVEKGKNELEKLFESYNDKVIEENDTVKSNDAEALSEGQNTNAKIEDNIMIQPKTRDSPVLTKDVEDCSTEKNQDNETKESPEQENVSTKEDSTACESKDKDNNVEGLSKNTQPPESETGDNYNKQNESMEIEHPSKSQPILKSPRKTSENLNAQTHSNELGKDAEMEDTQTEEVTGNKKDTDGKLLDHGTASESKDTYINAESLLKHTQSTESDMGDNYDKQNESMEMEYPSKPRPVLKSPGTTSESLIAQNHSKELGKDAEMEDTTTEEVNENSKDIHGKHLDNSTPEIESGNENQIMKSTDESKSELDLFDNEDENISDVDQKDDIKPALKLASFAEMSSKPVVASDNDNYSYRTYKATGCAQCFRKIPYTINALVWETMQFCDESCLAKYQGKMDTCSTCEKIVTEGCVGKYCVRFDLDLKQFCSNVCLESYKKERKVCCYCQKNIKSVDGILAPIGEKGQFKDFCAPECLQKYQELDGSKPAEKEITKCNVCSVEKGVEVKLILLPFTSTTEVSGPEDMQVDADNVNDKSGDTGSLMDPKSEPGEDNEKNRPVVIKLCSQACLSAYKFTHTDKKSRIIQPCDQCKTLFERLEEDSENGEAWLNDHANDIHVLFSKGASKRFCSFACQNVYLTQHRDIVPCMNCKVRKYNFDMIEKYQKPSNLPENAPIPSNTLPLYFCSINCLKQPSDLLSSNMLDVKPTSSQSVSEETPTTDDHRSHKLPINSTTNTLSQKTTIVPGFQTKFERQASPSDATERIVKPLEVKEVRHKAIMTKPFMMTKGVSCRPHPCHKQTQTDFPKHPALVPIAVPFYMPIPLSMYQKPYPVPIPVPLPIPVPIFVPTTRNSYRGIAKQIKKIRRKIPSDPFEAEMLSLAGGMDQNGDDSDDSLPDTSPLSPMDGDENEDRSNRNHRSQLELLAPIADLEDEIKGDRVVPKPLPQVTADPLPVPTPLTQRQGPQGQKPVQTNHNNFKRRHSATDDSEDTNDENHKGQPSGEWDGRRRSAAAAAASRRRAKQRREATGTAPGIGGHDLNNTVSSIAHKAPQDRPDCKNHLKFTYGVNAWKHWVVGKNAELEKARAQGKYMKPFETDLLKLRADELNYTLCMFVKEVKKPNGDSYAADSVLYLTYGIQEYLFENGRIDNIFTDQYYEPFTSALHEVVKDFKLPMNELGYYVTRIEEEHLWEAKQLGAHSPQVLLNTLVYFNTKYFMLRTVEDHQKLSFTHIMKHWKKAPGQKEGQKSVILRYYPPAKKGQRNDERKCYEQQESGENPLRCPVKLYEFYLSKCPESSKTRNDVFYLMPERSCVPDSPVWYSNSALPMHSIDKMLQRNLMVKEVQEHMLSDSS